MGSRSAMTGSRDGGVRDCGSALFPLGRVDVSPRVRAGVTTDEWAGAVGRHGAGIFGDVDGPSEMANENAIVTGVGAIRSVFVTASGVRFTVTTAPEWSVTWVALEGEAWGTP